MLTLGGPPDAAASTSVEARIDPSGRVITAAHPLWPVALSHGPLQSYDAIRDSASLPSTKREEQHCHKMAKYRIAFLTQVGTDAEARPSKALRWRYTAMLWAAKAVPSNPLSSIGDNYENSDLLQ
jgi:hypothetical protein